MKSIMIFGGLGFVGSKLAKYANDAHWKVFLADSRPGLEPYTGIQAECIDIASHDAVQSLIYDKEPDVIINLAAISDIDKCEAEKELAIRINTAAAENIAKCCKDINGKYIFFSSDAVFDGISHQYSESSPRNPLNFYGHTKLLAEDRIVLTGVKVCIIRISLVIGFSSVAGNSFFASLLKKLKANEHIFVSDEVRTPISVDILCGCILELAESDITGIMHIASTDYIDKFSLAKRAAEYMGYDPMLIQPATPDSMMNRAPRHKNGILSVEKAKTLLKTKLTSIECELKQIFGGMEQ